MQLFQAMQALEKYGHNIVIGENFANFLILHFYLSLNLTSAFVILIWCVGSYGTFRVLQKL